MSAIAVRHKFSIEEYHQLAESGILGYGQRYELIQGEIIEMIAKGVGHTFCSMQLIKELSRLLPESIFIRCQDPILLPSKSEPEPDFTLVYAGQYLSHHPQPEEIIWLIEIADSSLNYDRTVKLSLYAEAKIATYWIVNLLDRQLEVYTEPYQNHQNYGYRQRLIYFLDQKISLPSLNDLSLDLSKIFPEVQP